MDYLISIGIEEYQDAKFSKTIYANNDAEDFCSIVKRYFKCVEGEVLLNENASYVRIKGSLDTFMNKAIAGDRIIFYFAGHGVNFYNEPKIACYDSYKDVTEHPDSWYGLKQLMGFAVEKKVKLLAFVDACQSSISYSSRGEETLDTSVYENNDYVLVFSSADYNEKADIDEKSMHGIWTKYLLDAFTGDKRALDAKRHLTNNTLQNYLYSSLQEYFSCHSDKTPQTPKMWGKTSCEVLIHDYGTVKESIRVSEIYFGTIDADHEIKEKPKQFVDNFFDLNNAAHDIIYNKGKQFIVGRKGTGKTYIGKYLEVTRKDKTFYEALDSFDYKSFDFLAPAKKGYEPYVAIWKYYILANLLSRINERQIQCKDITDLLKELYGRRATQGQILHKKFKKGVAFQNVEIRDKCMKELATNTNNFELSDLIEIFKFTLEDNKGYEFLYILDGLDEKINEHPRYREIMNGLLWAITELNNYMNEYDLPYKIVAFFRTDVFDYVQGANTCKIAVGSSITLDWQTDADDKREYPLYQFLNKRYLNYLKEHGVPEEGRELRELFPETMSVGDEAQATWDWLLNFTTYKPRDIVYYLSLCGKKCKYGESVISRNIIWEVQREYSKYFSQELKNELHGFVEDDTISRLFNKVSIMKKFWNSYTTMQQFIASVKTDKEEVNAIICKMYEIGMIGIQLSNGHEHWSYRRSNVKISNYLESSKYKLHQGLWKELSIW